MSDAPESIPLSVADVDARNWSEYLAGFDEETLLDGRPRDSDGLIVGVDQDDTLVVHVLGAVSLRRLIVHEHIV